MSSLISFPTVLARKMHHATSFLGLFIARPNSALNSFYLVQTMIIQNIDNALKIFLCVTIPYVHFADHIESNNK